MLFTVIQYCPVSPLYFVPRWRHAAGALNGFEHRHLPHVSSRDQSSGFEHGFAPSFLKPAAYYCRCHTQAEAVFQSLLQLRPRNNVVPTALSTLPLCSVMIQKAMPSPACDFYLDFFHFLLHHPSVASSSRLAVQGPVFVWKHKSGCRRMQKRQPKSNQNKNFSWKCWLKREEVLSCSWSISRP